MRLQEFIGKLQEIESVIGNVMVFLETAELTRVANTEEMCSRIDSTNLFFLVPTQRKYYDTVSKHTTTKDYLIITKAVQSSTI